MTKDVVSVYPETDVETLLRLMREHELPGVPVIDHSDKVIGIVTDADLVIRDQDADLHLPHHIDLWGGVIYLESTKHFEGELAGMITRVDVLEALTRER